MAGSRQSLRPVQAETFGALLRRQRRSQDLTQAELAERFRVTQQTIGAWERGDRPQARLIEELADYIGLTQSALVDLLDHEVRAPSWQSDALPWIDDDLSDAVLMKRLTQYFLYRSTTEVLSDGERAIILELIAYFRGRAIES